MTAVPVRYQEWLAYVFEHPTDRDWYFKAHSPIFRASHLELVELITQTFLRCGQDLLYYTEAEINDGLKYIFENSCSNVVFSIKDDSVPIEKRLRAITSIKNLYKDCLDSRCAPVLGHTNQAGANPLNYICYMLWDVTPLSYWENQANKHIYYDAVIDVLEYVLFSCSNVACFESALHGLGHMRQFLSEKTQDRVSSIITHFISSYRKHPQKAPALRSYARDAAKGCIL